MAKQGVGQIDMAERAAAGVLNGVGAGAWASAFGRTNIVITGGFVGSARLESSFDGGVTAVPVTLADGTVRTFSGPDRVVIDEPERGVLYRVAVTALTSGTLGWRISR